MLRLFPKTLSMTLLARFSVKLIPGLHEAGAEADVELGRVLVVDDEIDLLEDGVGVFELLGDEIILLDDEEEVLEMLDLTDEELVRLLCT